MSRLEIALLRYIAKLFKLIKEHPNVTSLLELALAELTKCIFLPIYLFT